MPPKIIHPEHTQQIISSQKAALKTIANVYQLEALLKQLANPQENRPVDALDPDAYARHRVWNPLTDEWTYRGKEFSVRGAPKADAHHTKKIAVSLVPADGVFSVDYAQKGVSLLLDLDHCHLKAEKYMFSGRIDTAKPFWLKNRADLERHRSIGLTALQAYVVKQQASQENPETTLLAGLQADALIGIASVNELLSNRLAILRARALIEARLGRVVPLFILNDQGCLVIYDEAWQIRDVISAWKRSDEYDSLYCEQLKYCFPADVREMIYQPVQSFDATTHAIESYSQLYSEGPKELNPITLSYLNVSELCYLRFFQAQSPEARDNQSMLDHAIAQVKWADLHEIFLWLKAERFCETGNFYWPEQQTELSYRQCLENNRQNLINFLCYCTQGEEIFFEDVKTSVFHLKKSSYRERLYTHLGLSHDALSYDLIDTLMYTVRSNNGAIAKPANQLLNTLIYANLNFFKVNLDLIGCQQLLPPPNAVKVEGNRRIGQTLAREYKFYGVMRGNRYSLAHKLFYLIEHADFDIVQALLISAEHANKVIPVIPFVEDDGYSSTIEGFGQCQLDMLSFAVLIKKHAMVDFLLTLCPAQLTASLSFLKTMAKADVICFEFKIRQSSDDLKFSAEELDQARLALLLKLKSGQRYLCDAKEQALVAKHLLAELATLTDQAAVTQFWAQHRNATYLAELPTGHPGAAVTVALSSYTQVKLAVREKLVMGSLTTLLTNENQQFK